jgi:hypothetical protein
MEMGLRLVTEMGHLLGLVSKELGWGNRLANEKVQEMVHELDWKLVFDWEQNLVQEWAPKLKVRELVKDLV